MEFIGYIVAILIAIILVTTGYILVTALWRNQRVKGITLGPWRVSIEFYDVDS